METEKRRDQAAEDDGPDESEDTEATERAAQEVEGVKAAADDMESDLQDLEQGTGELDDKVDEAREDWRRKQRDSSVPGAEGSGDEPGDGGK